MSTFYLAARYSRREELLGYKADLEEVGHLVSARWLLGDHHYEPAELDAYEDAPSMPPLDLMRRFADDDLDDLIAADTVVAFTEEPRTTGTRGGRHVELGIALGLRIAARSTAWIGALEGVEVVGPRIFIVGPAENVFCALKDIDGHFPDWPTARETLR